MTKQRFLVAALAPVVVGALAFLSGCGEDTDNKPVESSPAAKAANASIEEANRKMLQPKGGSKGKTVGNPASKP